MGELPLGALAGGSAGPRELAVDLTTDALAVWVALESPFSGRFDDNGFAMLPGERRTLTFLAWEAVTLDDFAASLLVRSYSDVLPATP